MYFETINTLVTRGREKYLSLTHSTFYTKQSKTILSRLKGVHSKICITFEIIKNHNFKGSKYNIPLGVGCSFITKGV